jgi:PAS domain S-box-containing protein
MKMAGLQLSDENEERLRASEQRLAGILDSQETFIRRLDPQFRLTYINQTYARAFTLRIGDVMLSAVHPDDVERASAALANVQQPPYRSVVDVRNSIRGEWRWVRWENNGIRNSHGELVEIQGVGIDITVRRRNPDGVKAFLRAHLAAVRWINGNPDQARPVLAKRLNLGEEVVRKVRLLHWPVDARSEPALLDQTQQVMLRTGVQQRPVDTSRLYDETLLAEVLKGTR